MKTLKLLYISLFLLFSTYLNAAITSPVSAGYTLSSDETFFGDLNITGGTLDLNGFNLDVTGNVNHTSGALNLNGGSLNVVGNYINTSDTAGNLVMTNSLDYMYVVGNFTMSATADNNLSLTDGTLQITGNFTQTGSAFGFNPNTAHTTILSGTSLQTISFEDPGLGASNFHHLNITNISLGGISLLSDTYVNGTYNTTAISQVSNGFNFYVATALTDFDVVGSQLLLKAHGGALQLDDTLSNFTANLDLNITTTTLEFWFNFEQVGSRTMVRVLGDNGHYVDVLYSGESTLRYSDSDGATPQDTYGSISISDGLWHHVALVYDGGGNSVAYIDGVVDGSGFSTAFNLSNAGITFNPNNNMNMIIDEVRIWNIARTQTDINSSKNIQLDGNETGLVAYYNFDERKGSTVKDVTLNANDGAIEGNVTRLNFLGNGLSLDGNDYAVVSSTLPTSNSTEHTYSAWVNIPDTVGLQTIVRADPKHFLRLNGTNLEWNIATNLGAYQSAISYDFTAYKNKWTYVTATVNTANKNAQLYINGALVATNTSDLGDTLDHTYTAIGIGARNGDGEGIINGSVAEVSIWDKVLSRSEVQQFMASSLLGNETGLIGYWPLNIGGGSIAYDYTTNANNGTIIGATWTDTAPTIYGDTIYTAQGVGTFQKLVVENNTSIPTYAYNGTAPDSFSNLGSTSGLFIYKADANETLDINATDGVTTLNTLFNVISYPALQLSLNLSNVNLTEHNITNIQVFGVDGNSEDLVVPNVSSMIDGDNNLTVSVYSPDNNFTIRFDVNNSGDENSYYYNSASSTIDSALIYNGTIAPDDYKVEVNSTQNSFNIDLNSSKIFSQVNAQFNFSGTGASIIHTQEIHAQTVDIASNTILHDSKESIFADTSKANDLNATFPHIQVDQSIRYFASISGSAPVKIYFANDENISTDIEYVEHNVSVSKLSFTAAVDVTDISNILIKRIDTFGSTELLYMEASPNPFYLPVIDGGEYTIEVTFSDGTSAMYDPSTNKWVDKDTVVSSVVSVSADLNISAVIPTTAPIRPTLSIVSPEEVKLLGSYPDLNNSYAIALSSDGTKAYVADNDLGLVVFDITSDTPVLLGSSGVSTLSSAQEVVLSPDETKAYVADESLGLVVFDISSTTPAKFAASFFLGIRGVKLSTDGTKAYVNVSLSGSELQVLDISDPVNITQIGTSYYTLADINRFEISSDGKKLYMAVSDIQSTSNGLTIIDISTPTLSLLGTLSLTYGAYDLVLSSDGEKAYVANYEDGLAVLDISSNTPKIIGKYNTTGNAHRIKLSSDEKKAYVGDYLNGFVVLDVTTNTPSFIAETNTTQNVYDLVISSDDLKAYVADGSAGLAVVQTALVHKVHAGFTSFDVNITVNDAEQDDLNITVDVNDSSLVVTPQWPNNVLWSEYSSGNLVFTVTNDANATGTVAVDINVSDGTNAPVNRQFLINMNNNAPVLVQPSDYNKTEEFTDFNVTLEATDADGDALTYNASSSNTGVATVSVSSNIVTISPVENGNGLITIDVNVTDGIETVTQSFDLNITNVNDTPTGSVTITGTLAQNTTLTASNTLADADGLGTISYQWQADDVNISAATATTFTLTQAEVGKAITVVASYIDTQGTAESVTSSATGSVANVNDTPTGSVTITGTLAQNTTLTASNTLADADGLGTISYQWQADDVNISAATATTFTLTQAEVGKAITVVASYTDTQGTAESVTSSATGSVANVNDTPTGSVTITGTLAQNATLTAANTLADADGLGTISYQWQADDVNISAATATTFTLTQAEVGKAITVVASYIDTQGTAESVTSSATGSVANVNDTPTGSVTITGTLAQNATLTAANTLADADGLGTISYQWQADDVNISAATATTFTLTQAEVGKAITVVASYTDTQGTAESVTSSATGSVANVNDTPTGSVTITGTLAQNATLTAANTLADADGLGTISYQWQADDVNISAATATTFTLTQAEVGKAITVVASYTDTQGTAESVTSSATGSVANVNDTPTGSVTITGTLAQNATLTASNTLADADGLGTISYQWQADDVNISAATATTFTLTQAEVGKAITVVASYTDTQGTAESVTSSATGSVANVNDTPTGSVTITGTLAQNATLTAANTLADADGLGTISYQWQADDVNISAATATTFTLTQAEVGKAITVVASYIDTQGTAESVTSSATGSVANVNDTPTGSVTITGTLAQNTTLTASNTLADADGLGTISYQWQADDVNISAATATTFTLTQAEVGKAITVVASYIDTQGTAESVTSSATGSVANVNDTPTGSVTITGTLAQNATLTAANTLADADGLGTISYQWQADDVNISAATATTFTLTQAEVGKAITVVASYIDTQGTAESVTSSATGSVANVNDTPTGSVTITGTLAQNTTLTASNTLADADGLGTISYQWQADDVNISAATATTFTLTQAEVGKAITVVASYIDTQGTAESVTSSATGSVANVNDTPTGSVTITGTLAQNATLTAANTLADADGLGTISYQWQADDVNISAATATTFTLTQAEVGKAITVVASYIDTQGTAESVTSSATGSVANVNDTPTGSVTITGTLAQNATLTAANTLADADGLGTISYQWQADDVNISAATATTFTLTQAEVGKAITVVASYIDTQGTAESVTSSATGSVANVNDTPTGSVTITGTLAQNATLTAANTLADADGLGTISYQWQADDVNISAATATTFTLTQAEVGKAITVVASYTDTQGTAESVTSSATGSVANVNDTPTGSVTITGTLAQNATLTAANTLADADGLGTISYQWQADDVNISAATATTFTLTQAEVGKAITVVASYIDTQGTAESVTSSATTAVANVDDAPILTTLADPVSQDEDFSDFNITLSANDVESDAFTFTATSNDESKATVNVVGNQLVVSSTLNASGVVTFNIVVTQDSNTSLANGQMITLNIDPVNDRPLILNTIEDLSLDEDNGTTSYQVNITDVEGEELNVTVESNNTSILTVNPNWSGLLSFATYGEVLLDFNLTTVENANGIVRITMNVNDGDLNSTQTFDVNVTAVNDAPTLDKLSDINVSEDFVDFNITLNGNDVDGVTIIYYASSSDTNVTSAVVNENTLITSSVPNEVKIVSIDANVTEDATNVDNLIYNASSSDTNVATVAVSSNTLTISSVPNAFGIVNIDVNVTDGFLSATQTFVLNVSSIDDAPVLSAPLDINTSEDFTDFNITLEATDADGDSIFYTATTTDENVTLNVVGNIIVVTPVANANGVVNIEVNATANGVTDSKTFSIYIEAVEDEDFNAPTITSIADISKLTNSPEFQVEFFIDDIEKRTLKLELITSTNTVLDANLSKSGLVSSKDYSQVPLYLLIKPRVDAEGIVEFELRVTDEGNNSANQKFKVTVENQQYHIITSSESEGVFDEIPTTSFSGDLYTLRTWNDYTSGVAHIVGYERLTINSGTIMEDNYIVDINGLVTHTKTTPDTNRTIKFEEAVDNMETSYLYLSYGMPFEFSNPNSKSQKMYIKEANGDITSYVLLNKEAKDEIYKTVSVNPKIQRALNNGYTYLSLTSSKTLCDEDVKTEYLQRCDQVNSLDSVFGTNENIDTVMKFGREWMYWDKDATSSAAFTIQKFLTLNPLEGILVHTTAATTVELPFDEDSLEVNNFTNLFPRGWILMSNTKEQTTEEIKAALKAQNKTLEYILVLRNNEWQIFAPLNDSEVDNTITRVSDIKRYESFWVLFK
ncbi:hypothetical protein GJV85_01600 [Sulfurimonas aquatica]|uniref:LamG-like jellyroll fold domain-containing protein n=1 Tax=Sulfurimonas aquatica TaxID=2672570 RepID=A0A975AYJ8_9BACT|nr:LamG-like jellyroll fold domain-containing protein [Sulfurimonas aquatica]QSZ40863.1 hypothetical protein GJV85_01600 [Sulfurimonas aquatica]